ncbi:MAG: hypothetical protein EA364_01390 [Balneolaceae bacterium]|nr:MAG: hypothetical protein EA364_01390 [Balneolaceae bacterium]
MHLPLTFCLLPSKLLPFAFCLFPAFCLTPSNFCLLISAFSLPFAPTSTSKPVFRSPQKHHKMK